MSAAGPSQGANYAPSGGSAAAELSNQAASVGVHSDAVVAVIGAGAMGTGIAQVAAQAGHPVRLFDARMGAAEAGGCSLRRTLHAPSHRRKETVLSKRHALSAAQRQSL